jgi:hypothetical protein
LKEKRNTPQPAQSSSAAKSGSSFEHRDGPCAGKILACIFRAPQLDPTPHR